jgi:hypothetical protein
MRRSSRASARFVLLGAAVLVAGAFAGCARPAATGGTGGGAVANAAEDAAARRYCTDKSGQLVERTATWNANADPQARLELAGEMTFCEFESGKGDQTTRIAVDLVTLSSEQPTLAAIAYLSKIGPVLPDTPSVNPATWNCNRGLGGAAAFGNTAAGGGWVDDSQPVYKIMDMCVFADESAIDAFGIFYYANDTVRGADLAPLFRYQPGTRLPAVFEEPRR